MKWLIAVLLITLAGCRQQQEQQAGSIDQDSISNNYTLLKDSVMMSWTVMMNADAEKIGIMRKLAHQLTSANGANQDLLKSIDERINNLNSLRFTQMNLSDANRVEEYDFAFSSLVNELTTQAEAEDNYDADAATSNLVETLRNADASTDSLRAHYDESVGNMNSFATENKEYLMPVNPVFLPQFDSLSRVYN